MHKLAEDELDKIKNVLKQLDPNLALADIDCVGMNICALDIADLRYVLEDTQGMDVDTVTVGQALKLWSKIAVSNK